jgi:hypothetical protein
MACERNPLSSWRIPCIRPAATKGVLMKTSNKALLALIALLLAALAIVRISHKLTPVRELTLAQPGAVWRAPGGIGGQGSTATEDGVAMPSWFGQRGASVRRVAGRVTFDGSPVADATVELASSLSDAGVIPVKRRTTSADGRFDFGVQAPAKFSVAANAAGRAPAIVEVDTRDPTSATEHLELSLTSCDCTVFGNVNDASGGPIAAARVCLAPPRSSACVTADAKGAYSICLTQRQPIVSVGAAGYGAIYDRVEFSGRRVQRNYSLSPDATIVGRVVSTEGNAPIAGATVRVVAVEDQLQRFSAPGATTTDKDGTFTISGIAPGRVRVVALADRYPPSEPVEVGAEAGRPTGQLLLRLRPGSHVRGVVTDGTHPIAGATISFAAGQAVGLVNAVTQSDGSFVIDSATRGRNVITIGGYEVTEPKILTIDRDELTDAHITVSAMASVAGHVTRQGQPVKNARVSCSARIQPTFSDEQGAYVLHGLPPGHYQVSAESSKFGAFGQADFAVEKGEHREGVDINAKFAGAISGVVVQGDGKPVGGVSVRFDALHSPDRGEDVTAPDGTFKVRTLMGGDDYRGSVRESARNFAALRLAEGAVPTVTLRDGSAEVTGVQITVERDHLTISGSVVDGDGQPMSDVHVEAFPADNGRPTVFDGREFPSAISKSDGSFRIEDLDDGTYDVRGRSGDGSESTVRGIHSGTESVVVKLQHGGGINGSLVGFSSTVAVKAVRLVPGAPQPPLFAQVDGSTFQLRGLSPGPYQVIAIGAEGDMQTVDVSSGQIASVTLTSRSTTSINGRVVEWKTGAPIAGMECVPGLRTNTSTPQWIDDLASYSAASGTFTIDHAPTGAISVGCNSATNQYTIGRADAVLVGDQPGNVTVTVVRVAADKPFANMGAQFQLGSSPPQFSFIAPGGPADKAGIHVGDTIASIDSVDASTLLPMGAQVVICQRPAGSVAHVGLGNGNAVDLVLR